MTTIEIKGKNSVENSVVMVWLAYTTATLILTIEAILTVLQRQTSMSTTKYSKSF